MNELLSVVLDCSLDTLSEYPYDNLLRDLATFLNAYQLMSSKNVYRVYAAFPAGAQLLFPLTEEHEQLQKRLAMKDIVSSLIATFDAVINSDKVEELYGTTQVKKSSALA